MPSSWEDLVVIAENRANDLPEEYKSRLKIELSEILKQVASDYWVDLYDAGEKIKENNNGLVLPWLLGITNIDPVKDNIAHKWKYHSDFPDIDIDFLPISRKDIKEYAAQRYGEDKVCSVGNWITYKFKSALQDACRALGGDVDEAIGLTTKLPDEIDEMSLQDLVDIKHKMETTEKQIRDSSNPSDELKEEYKKASSEYGKYAEIFEYARKHSEIVKYTYKLIGMIRSAGTHAGGLIISSVPLKDVIPMYKSKAAGWASQWTEGRSTQMSKFGLVKFDILGLATMQYIWQCCNMIEKNRGIKINWDMDPTKGILGWEINGDDKKPIKMNDPESMEAINDLRTDSVFQHETSIQKGLIKDGGVKDYWDMMVISSLGRPGPMSAIPAYFRNRDDKKKKWKEKEHSKVAEILEKTHGVLAYQEDLTNLWMNVAHFTSIEAEEARKIISKKWVEKLPKVREKWLKGASKTIGYAEAEDFWNNRIEPFGRYAFNLSHACAYAILSFRCIYLKTHYPSEWWASVMSNCHQDKLKRYMSCARIDGVDFAPLDVNKLSTDFIVDGDYVRPGLTGIKGVGDKMAEKLTSMKGPFNSIEEFINQLGKNKNAMERLVCLGAFDSIEPNRRGLWEWYKYKYGSGKDIDELRNKILEKFRWSQEDIQKEIDRQVKEYIELYPKRKKIPSKILKWLPKIGHNYDVPSMKQVVDLFPNYTLKEQLEFQKEFLGYYWQSPMNMYVVGENTSIADAYDSGVLECTIDRKVVRTNKENRRYAMLDVSDGMQGAKVVVWPDSYEALDKGVIAEGAGVRMAVKWNDKFENFSVSGTDIHRLGLKK